MTDRLWIGNNLLYINTIQDVYDMCKAAIKEADIEPNDLDGYVDTTMRFCYSMGDFMNAPTSVLITAILNSTMNLLKNRFRDLGIDVDVDYFSNYDDSHLYINNEEYFKDEGTIRELITATANEEE